VTTDTARGTFWTFSERFWAVTTTVSRLMESDAVCAKAGADMASSRTGAEAQQSSLFM
jgi:hypothetical protein